MAAGEERRAFFGMVAPFGDLGHRIWMGFLARDGA